MCCDVCGAIWNPIGGEADRRPALRAVRRVTRCRRGATTWPMRSSSSTSARASSKRCRRIGARKVAETAEGAALSGGAGVVFGVFVLARGGRAAALLGRAGRRLDQRHFLGRRCSCLPQRDHPDALSAAGRARSSSRAKMVNPTSASVPLPAIRVTLRSTDGRPVDLVAGRAGPDRCRGRRHGRLPQWPSPSPPDGSPRSASVSPHAPARSSGCVDAHPAVNAMTAQCRQVRGRSLRILFDAKTIARRNRSDGRARSPLPATATCWSSRSSRARSSSPPT